MTITNYGPVYIARVGVITGKKYGTGRETSKPKYAATCSEHGLIYSGKQLSRVHTAARGHALEHGLVFTWEYDAETETWHIDGPNNLQCVYWTNAAGDYSWAVLEPASPESQTGMLTNGVSANQTAARVSATLALESILKDQ